MNMFVTHCTFTDFKTRHTTTMTMT